MSYEAPNYTQIPNALLDEHLPHMKEAELKVTLAIARKTFGWHKQTDKISLSQLMEITGMSSQGVRNGLSAGMKRGTIERTPDGQGFVYHLAISSPKTMQPSSTVDETAMQRSSAVLCNEVAQLDAKPRYEVATQKKGIKETIKEKREREAIASPPPTKHRLPNNDYEMPEPSTASTTPPPLQKKYTQVTSKHLDPRKFVNGFIPAGSGATAVEVYYESFSCSNKLTEPDQYDLVSYCTDLDKLRQVIVTYRRCNFRNEKNIKLILDWYKDGINPRYQSQAAVTAAGQPVKDFNTYLLNRYGTNTPTLIGKSKDELRAEFNQHTKGIAA